MEYRAGGECVRIVPPPEVTKEAAKMRNFGGVGGSRGDRQRITGFSTKSRLALRRKFDCLDEKSRKKCLFTTLTYEENMLDGEQAHKDLNAFGSAMLRKFGEGVGFLWKMEQQKRGSIHFHLLIFGVSYMKREKWDQFVQWLAFTWARIVAHGGEISIKQIQAGTSIELAEKGAVRSYLEKYIAKVLSPDGEQLPEIENPGRFWGERFMKQFFAPKVEIPISRRQAIQLSRILDNYRRSRIREQWGLKHLNATYLKCVAMRRFSRSKRPLRTWVAKEGKVPPDDDLGMAIPIVDTWMLRWAKKRKKHVGEQRSYWCLSVGDLAPKLIDWLYTQ
jgi:hypothetical protein